MACLSSKRKNMKALLWSAIGFLFFSSCNPGPKHPQAGLVQQNGVMTMSEQEILNYADSIDASLAALTKESSLVFKISPDESLAVDQYRNASQQPVCYIEHNSTAGISDIVSTYYLKNDSLLLVRKQQTQLKNGLTQFNDQRSYLRNNIVFKVEEKSGTDSSGLTTKRFAEKKNPQDKTLNPYKEKLGIFKEALSGLNKFELVFDKLVQLPDARYLLLKGKIPNGYSASILIEEPDLLIDSLQNDPNHFRARKIDFKWKVKDHEAIYVPVAAGLTSASGLNK
jgi:hypothetical protein